MDAIMKDSSKAILEHKISGKKRFYIDSSEMSWREKDSGNRIWTYKERGT